MISMWQGLGGQINHFRKRQLLLGHLHRRMAPSVLDELRIPWTYCWSPDLLPKPRDWRDNIDISGFYFLDTDVAYTPPPDLSQFLAAGSPPIYIGFGSIPIPNADTITSGFACRCLFSCQLNIRLTCQGHKWGWRPRYHQLWLGRIGKELSDSCPYIHPDE
jgi:hypothetical protein